MGQCCLTISHCLWLKAVASHHSVLLMVVVNLSVLFVLLVCKGEKLVQMSFLDLFFWIFFRHLSYLNL